MHILLIDLDAPDPVENPSNPVHTLARFWVELSHSVTVIQSTKRPSNALTRTDSQSAIEVAGVNYLFLNRKLPAAPGFKAVLDLCTARLLLALSVRKIVASQPIDVVVAASKSQIDNESAYHLARRHRSVFIRQTNHLSELSHLPSLHPYALLTRRAETLACRHASMVITTLPDSFDRMHALGLDRERWIHLPQTTQNLRSLAPLYLRIFEESAKAR